MATDFTTSYAQSAGATVGLYTDVGTGIATSSGFITKVGGQNYIITAAHAVLRDRSVWSMSDILLSEDGSQECDRWKSSGQLALPTGVQTIVFRSIGAGGVLLDNVVLKDSTGVTFKDTFSGSSTFGPQWSSDLGPPWTVVKFKGRCMSSAARSGDLTNGADDLSTLVLKVTTTEPTMLKFDYKLDCAGGSFVVGYCSEVKCSQLSTTIQGYYGQHIHPLRVVGLDGKGDIAMCLPADGSDLNQLPSLRIVENNKSIPIATPVAVIGNPLGIDASSIATGVLRDNSYVLPTAQVVESVLTSTTDFPGNSGGPYLLLDGSVVGLNTFGLASDSGGESTLNGGPSAHILNQVLRSLATRVTGTGFVEYQKAYLGVQLVGVDMNIVNQLGLPMTGPTPLATPSGFVVTRVEDDSPLFGRLQPLDVLLTLRRSGDAIRLRLGVFPSQASPSEVTWFMPPTGKVDIELLRFDLVQAVWAPLSLADVELVPYPAARDVPVGPVMSYAGGIQPFARITRRQANGQVVNQRYSLSRAI